MLQSILCKSEQKYAPRRAKQNKFKLNQLTLGVRTNERANVIDRVLRKKEITRDWLRRISSEEERVVKALQMPFKEELKGARLTLILTSGKEGEVEAE